MKPGDLKKALRDPQSVFRSAEDLLSAQGLTKEQRIEILRRWEYNAADEAVALEEGMPGEESDLLRRILLALGEIAGPIDVERTEPTKQHGLSREAVGRRRDPKE